MILSTERTYQPWPLGDGVITYRIAESMDHDICTQTARRWITEITQAKDTAHDFGLTGSSVKDLVQEMVTFGQDDLRPWADYLFCVAIGLRCIQSIENILVPIDPEKPKVETRPLEVNRQDLAILFRDKAIKDAFKSKVLVPLYQVATAGNG